MALRSDILRALALALGGAAAIAVAAAGAVALWGPRLHPTTAAAVTAIVFLLIRGALTIAGAARRARRRGGEQTPLARLVQRYARQVDELDSEADVAAATDELFEVGLGFARITLLVPSASDYSWYRAGGARLGEDAAPDPRLIPWLLDADRPVERSELEHLDSDELHAPLEALFSAHDADLAVPLVSRDELVGLIAAGAREAGPKLSLEERGFMRRVMDQVAAALVYVRMKRSAIERVELAKDVELTAAVQEAFIPARDVTELGPIRIAGTYIPASRCGGDWWSMRTLARDRALVLIGDATGHGISAAMVTAAVKGCADVALERLGDDPDLGQLFDTLDGAIRRVGAGQFYLTLFATIIDAREGRVEFANAGHNVPYLCHPREGKRPELKVLPARGDPLGSGDGPVYELGAREIGPDDVLVWYTDGIVEASDDELNAYGDRRMQRQIRELVAQGADVAAIRDGLLRASLTFQGRGRPHDDMTAVVAAISRDRADRGNRGGALT